jgi:hypothetical protein
MALSDIEELTPALGQIAEQVGDQCACAIFVFEDDGGVGVLSTLPTRAVLALVARWCAERFAEAASFWTRDDTPQA